MMEEQNETIGQFRPFTPPTVEQVRNSSIKQLLNPYNSCKKCTPLGHAIKYRITLAALTMWLDRAPDVISIRNEHGNIALSQISTHAHKEQALLIANRTRANDLLLVDNDGNTPLHCIVQRRASENVVRITMEKCPLEVFTIGNKKGRLPIHEAVEHGASLDIVKFLIRQSPSHALRMHDTDGRLPVHYITNRTLLKVAKLLINLSGRNALTQADKTGMLPLHSALLTGADIQVISLLVKRSPKHSLYTADEKGRFPLHIALEKPRHPSRALVELLMGESPRRVLLQQDDRRQFPLYIAISNHRITLNIIHLLVERSPPDMMDMVRLQKLKTALSHSVAAGRPEEVIRFLLNHTPPDILSSPDINGRQALHYIGRKMTNPDVVTLLAENNPEVLTCRCNYGKTPMHFAMERGLSLPVVKRLFETCPEVLAIPDRDGRLPLHFLSLTNYTHGQFPVHMMVPRTNRLDVQRMMVEISSTNHILTADSDGQLPIHRAILGYTSREIIELLIERCPASLFHFDSSGRLPLHHALLVEHCPLNVENLGETNDETLNTLQFRRRRALLRKAERRRQEVVNDGFTQMLVRHCPEALKIADNKGRLPLHFALEMKVPFKTIEVLLDGFSGAVTVRDERDQLPLHIACDTDASLDVVYKITRLSPNSLCELGRR